MAWLMWGMQAGMQAAGTVLAADLVSGLVHWWEDRYLRLDAGLLRQVAVDNLRHHARPREFLAKGWWASSWDLVLLGAGVVGGAALLGVLHWTVVLFAVLVAQANQVHKWAHANGREKPALVTALQQWRVLQTPRHHAAHHLGTRDTHFCVLTNVLNPVLERVQLWRRLEDAVAALTGVQPRDEAAALARLGLVPPR